MQCISGSKCTVVVYILTYIKAQSKMHLKKENLKFTIFYSISKSFLCKIGVLASGSTWLWRVTACYLCVQH